MLVREYFSEEERQRMIDAIRTAENGTSGEIRVHIEKNCKGSPLDRASYIFRKLKMDETELRNGVLFYLAINDRKFAIIGDAGINQKVPGEFWNEIYDLVTGYLKKNQYSEGVAEGVLMAGKQLKYHFPHQTDDKNELPDEISFDAN